MLPSFVEAKQISIKAYVNNTVITTVDIANRQKILRDLGNMQYNDKATLEVLIDEAVIMQIAASNNKVLTAQQSNELKRNIAIQAGFESYHDFTRKRNIDPKSLQEQLESSYLMGYFIEHFIKRSINISEYHVHSNILGLGASSNIRKENIEFEFSQLTLEEEHANANEIIKKIQQDIETKTPFLTIVRNYSNTEVHNLGRLKFHQLQKSVCKAILGKKIGDVVGPIYSGKKVFFLQINNLSYTKLNYKQVSQFLFNYHLTMGVREFITKYRGDTYIRIV